MTLIVTRHLDSRAADQIYTCTRTTQQQRPWPPGFAAMAICIPIPCPCHARSIPLSPAHLVPPLPWLTREALGNKVLEEDGREFLLLGVYVVVVVL